MKKSTILFVILISSHMLMAQEAVVRKEITIKDPLTKTQVKIETGSTVSIWFKKPKVRRTGIVMSLADSSMLVSFSKELNFVFFRDFASISVVPVKMRRYMAEVKFRSGEKTTGELIHLTPDSLGVLLSRGRLLRLNASEIKLIRIRLKGYTGMAIGMSAVVGATIGTLAAHESFNWDSNKNYSFNETDKIAASFHGFVVGALVGVVTGALIGTISSRYDIEGDRARLDLFVNTYKKKIPPKLWK